MLIDPRIDKMARVLVEYSLGVQPGWTVTVVANAIALPLVYAVSREVLRAGGHPYALLDSPELRALLLRSGSDEQLRHTNPYHHLMVESSDAILRIGSEENTRAAGSVDPGRQALLQSGLRPVSAGYMKRIAEGRPHCLTIFPTQAYAQDAEMSLADFEGLVFRACLLEGEGDPVEAWREVSRYQQRAVDWLAGKRQVHVEGPGTDLTMSIEGRVFINSDGKRNFPSGEIFTAPVEHTVQGHITFTYPASVSGRAVQGVHLRFEDGRVVSASAEQGEEYFRTMLDVDEGAKRLGEFAIGTNKGVTRPTRNILLDEKIAGTIHCALGEAYPNAGGTNKSAIHWDLVTDMREGRITVDGATLYERGEFTI